MHGGNAPQVREAARRRLTAFADRALTVLERLAEDPDVSPAVRRAAASDLLDRAGLKGADELHIVPRDVPNEDLDAAIALAMLQRGLMGGQGVGPGSEDETAEDTAAEPEDDELPS